ncbi:type I secretion system permease/ATPase, partial [Escherichia coli]
MNNDIALSALVMLAQYHGIAVSPKDIEHQFDPERKGISEKAWVLAARQVGLKSRLDNKPITRLPYLTLPLLVWRDDGEHFILAAIDKTTNRYLIHDFHEDRPITLSKEVFEERYSGKVISVASRSSVLGKLARFDFSWFIPVVIKYRRIFIEVIVASIALQL